MKIFFPLRGIVLIFKSLMWWLQQVTHISSKQTIKSLRLVHTLLKSAHNLRKTLPTRDIKTRINRKLNFRSLLDYLSVIRPISADIVIVILYFVCSHPHTMCQRLMNTNIHYWMDCLLLLEKLWLHLKQEVTLFNVSYVAMLRWSDNVFCLCLYRYMCLCACL